MSTIYCVYETSLVGIVRKEITVSIHGTEDFDRARRFAEERWEKRGKSFYNEAVHYTVRVKGSSEILHQVPLRAD